MRRLALIRSLTSASVMLSGVVHLELWAQGMSALDVVGPAFLVNAVVGLVLGVTLQLWEHWLTLLLAAGFGAATLGAFLLSTTVGFFGVHEHWQGPAVWLSAVSEVAAIVLGLTGTWLQLRAAGGGTSAKVRWWTRPHVREKWLIEARPHVRRRP